MALYGCFSDQDSVYLICELASDGSLYDALGSGQGNVQRKLNVDLVRNYVGQLC